MSCILEMNNIKYLYLLELFAAEKKSINKSSRNREIATRKNCINLFIYC